MKINWFKPVDNIGLILWRVIFGALITLESFGAILTGWVKEVLIEPDFTFTFIGFDWLQPLPGYGMYLYYALMGMSGLAVMLGYRYRWSMLFFAVLWTGTYLMQKSAYNNHYYLLCLLSWLMVFAPSSKDLSHDALKAQYRIQVMPNWVKVLFIGQVLIIFTYAAWAKLYPDWIDGSVIALFMESKKNYFLIGPGLQEIWLQKLLVWGGIFFDALIIPGLIWQKTRVPAFIVSIGFHLFNSVVFQIGIFPFMSIAFALFFFSPETLRHRFNWLISHFEKQYHKFTNERAAQIQKTEVIHKNSQLKSLKWIQVLVIIYLIIQIILPIRHYLIQDKVLWTEEGHRMSWRMMLRARNGVITFYTMEPGNGLKSIYPIRDLVTQKQYRMLASHPDFIWQMAQRIQIKEASKGREVWVFAKSKVSVNGREYSPMIDSGVNLTKQVWDPWRHNDWVLPSPF